VVPHAADVEEVARELGSDPARGLGSDEATVRLARYGTNELQSADPVQPGRILLDQLTSPMLLLLAAAGVLSGALGDVAEAIVIFVVVGLNAWIGFRQEYRAERAMASLQAMATPMVRLLRDGATRELPAREVVPGTLCCSRPERAFRPTGAWPRPTRCAWTSRR
jgi:P-type Ca2+ transporter type 2C